MLLQVVSNQCSVSLIKQIRFVEPDTMNIVNICVFTELKPRYSRQMCAGAEGKLAFDHGNFVCGKP